MKFLPATLLIISTLLPGTARASDETDLAKAPQVDLWPKNLPPSQQAPDGTVCLPAPLSDAVHGRLVQLDRFPERCQGAMDAQAAFLGQQCAEMRGADASHAAVECSRKTSKLRSEQWRWYQIGGLIVGSLAVGFVVGVVAEHH